MVGVNGYDIIFKLDTGPDADIMPKSQLNTWASQPVHNPTAARVTAYAGWELPIEAESERHCSAGENQFNLQLLVVS
ncbi:hypothetical protein HPB50_012842 [Hyalomma asiaticum]|uniref:Uncharacterized protein n=1 Tax=Hyalomma asiaticum TaxID=266040 RepID=A0ACB7T7A3_HYAAI|nr:hypothetical protein HPB50_012842 [Hyalomma asiaticum]